MSAGDLGMHAAGTNKVISFNDKGKKCKVTINKAYCSADIEKMESVPLNVIVSQHRGGALDPDAYASDVVAHHQHP